MSTEEHSSLAIRVNAELAAGRLPRECAQARAVTLDRLATLLRAEGETALAIELWRNTRRTQA